MTTVFGGRTGRYDPDNPPAIEPPLDEPARVETVSRRHAAMMAAISALRLSRRGSFPLETVLLTLGAMCLPAGIIAILVGWYGAAHTGHLWEQNDYLISGGVLGLGLVFIGGFLYFGYWMTRQIRTTEAGNQHNLRALNRLEAQLTLVAQSAAASAAALSNGKGKAHFQDAGESLVATEHGKLMHRPSCPAVAGKANLRSVERDTSGLRPCQVCDPLG